MNYLRQSTASQSRLLGQFVDSTDGATAETGLTIANTDIRLSKNGGNMAAKNSGGGTHDELGYYTVTFDATDTDTAGVLQVVCKMSGALVVEDTYQVLEEAVYDALFASSAGGFASITALATAQADLDTITGSDGVTLATSQANYAPATAAALATVDGNVDAILLDTAEIGAAGAGLTALATQASVNTIDANVDAILVDTGTDIPARFDGIEGATFSTSTDSLEALRNRGDSAWITATGFSTLAATDILSDGTALNTTSGVLDVVNLVNTTTTNTDMRGTDSAYTGTPPTAAAIVNEWESQSQADPTGFHVNVIEVGGTAQGATDIDARFTAIEGATFSGATDSLEAIRNRGDAAWTTGAGGTPPQLLQSTTIATLASQTSFTLTAGSADDDAYNGAIVVVTDQSTATQKAVGTVSDYTGSTKTVTLSADPAVFTMATGDTIEIIAALGSAGTAPTVAQIRAEMDSNSTKLAAIVADTNELQTNQGDWATATGFATSSALTTAQNDLDILTGSDGVTLATSQPNYTPATSTALSSVATSLSNFQKATVQKNQVYSDFEFP